MNLLSWRHMRPFTVMTAVSATLALSACSDDDTEQPQSVIPAETATMLTNYADIVHASYVDSLSAAEALDTSIGTLVTTPSAANLDSARQAWLDSREPYLQTEVYRFYDGPIDNPDDGPEGLLNAWPMDEAYVDYVEGDPMTGIVNDPMQDITAANLQSLNEQGGEENIATGYHAIEFLLWGQDLSETGPGARPFSDYEMGGMAGNADRRGLYLNTVSDLLLTHLEQLVTAWDPNGSGNYRESFLAADPKEGLRRVLTGMIVLSGFETGGERLQAALDSGDQEDEHSCFSDNTHRDMVQDVRGVQNVFLGTYGSVNGLGMKDIIAARDATLASQIETQIAESLAAAEALQPPFDQEIAAGNAEGRARVEALILSLRAQEKLLEDAFRLFELEVPVVE